jgi:hypothetical protein
LIGLLGEEVGTKLSAFLALPIDIEDYIKRPELFLELEERARRGEEKAIDSQYMVSCMLGTWFSKNYRRCEKGFKLLDVMSQCSREWIVLSLMVAERKHLPTILNKLFSYNSKYQTMLEEIVLSLKAQI